MSVRLALFGPGEPARARSRRSLGAACLALGIFLNFSQATMVMPRAEAAFPGRNGQIVFEVKSDPLPTNGYVDDYDLFTVGPGGSNLTRLTEGPEADFSAAWSADGSRLAFARALPFGRAADIYVMNADGTGITNLTNTPLDDDWAPDWSPDGSRIAFTRAPVNPVPGTTSLDTDIYVMNADGTNAGPLVTGSGQQTHPAWSPRGSWIAFQDAVTRSIQLVRPDGSRRHALTPEALGRGHGAEWSPDGRRIAFFTREGIWLIRPDGTGLEQLTSMTEANEFFPAWSPDGEQIAFSAQSANSSGLYLIDMKSRRIHQVVDVSLTIFAKPDWGPRP